MGCSSQSGRFPVRERGTLQALLTQSTGGGQAFAVCRAVIGEEPVNTSGEVFVIGHGLHSGVAIGIASLLIQVLREGGLGERLLTEIAQY